MKSIELILVPTDFSPYSCEAFAWASFIAEKFGSKILILHVIQERTAEDMVSIPGNPWERVLEREDDRMIQDFSASLSSDFDAALEKESLVAVGEAPEKIVDVAGEREAGLIVMSTHGRTGLSHVLMGSVAERVVRLAPCPVLSVKPKGLSTAK